MSIKFLYDSLNNSKVILSDFSHCDCISSSLHEDKMLDMWGVVKLLNPTNFFFFLPRVCCITFDSPLICSGNIKLFR